MIEKEEDYKILVKVYCSKCNSNVKGVWSKTKK